MASAGTLQYQSNFQTSAGTLQYQSNFQTLVNGKPIPLGEEKLCLSSSIIQNSNDQLLKSQTAFPKIHSNPNLHLVCLAGKSISSKSVPT